MPPTRLSQTEGVRTVKRSAERRTGSSRRACLAHTRRVTGSRSRALRLPAARPARRRRQPRLHVRLDLHPQLLPLRGSGPTRAALVTLDLSNPRTATLAPQIIRASPTPVTPPCAPPAHRRVHRAALHSRKPCSTARHPASPSPSTSTVSPPTCPTPGVRRRSAGNRRAMKWIPSSGIASLSGTQSARWSSSVGPRLVKERERHKNDARR